MERRSHIIDFLALENNFSTPEMRGIWNEENRLQKQLQVEKALALTEGELGVIPKDAAEAIAAKADIQFIDLKETAAKSAAAKHSFLGVVRTLQEAAGKAGEYVHFGATTQDIVDTGTVLQLKDAHALIKRDVKKIIQILAEKAQQYRDLPTAARTHGVQALPTTYGFRFAIWLAEIGRHLERLQELEKRVFAGVLAGAVGTYASLGEKGPEVEKETLQKLGLEVPEICWHSSRDRFAEYTSVLALLSGTLGKIAHELYFLMSTEVQEVDEPFTEGEVGSSTMPQKRNPALLEGIASLTHPVFHSASLVRDALLMEHERDAIGWRAEWIGVPESCLYISSQLGTSIHVLEGLQLHRDKILRNLELTGGLIVSERIMFELGKYVGKQTAHEIVYELSMQAQEKQIPFSQLLKEDKEIGWHFTPAQIDDLLDPLQYTGQAREKVDAVIALARNKKWLDA